MPYEPKIHHRRSIRLKLYDYSARGWYFVTICVQEKEHLLAEVGDGGMRLNEAGQIVQRAWQILPARFPGISLDDHVVMPNHFHGIVQFVGAVLAPPGNEVGAVLAPPRRHGTASHQGAASSAPTLGAVVRAFKSLSAIAVNALLSRQGRPLWQRNYYEHIIRDERELWMIREYIRTNPQRWGFDRENPAAAQHDPEPWT
jgi:REP element-mobilizing transposase RayT